MFGARVVPPPGIEPGPPGLQPGAQTIYARVGSVRRVGCRAPRARVGVIQDGMSRRRRRRRRRQAHAPFHIVQLFGFQATPGGRGHTLGVTATDQGRSSSGPRIRTWISTVQSRVSCQLDQPAMSWRNVSSESFESQRSNRMSNRVRNRQSWGAQGSNLESRNDIGFTDRAASIAA